VAALLSKFVKKSQQRFDFPIGSRPKQAFAVVVDLINEGQVFMTTKDSQFVYSDIGDPVKISMSQAKVNDILNCTIDAVPACLKDFGYFLPTDASCPFGQEDFLMRRSGDPFLRPMVLSRFEPRPSDIGRDGAYTGKRP